MGAEEAFFEVGGLQDLASRVTKAVDDK